ncbi:hypothetical protein GCM10025858_27570 [Alicyclobacillus sacchari]|nr:hypothetical protein GCM10025858_27570 [Alicyclobacillus sacchari]
MDEMDMNAPQSSLNPLNPNDPILPNGVPASDQKTLTQIGAALYLTIWILAFGLPSESFKRKHKWRSSRTRYFRFYLSCL